MGVALLIGAVVILLFLLIIFSLKVRVITFAAPSLKELEKQINTFTGNHFFSKIQDVTIRDEEGQYYGYVRWLGFDFSEEWGINKE